VVLPPRNGPVAGRERQEMTGSAAPPGAPCANLDSVITQLLAGLGLAVCLMLLLRMALPAAQQRRFDAFWRRVAGGLQRAGLTLRQRWQALRGRPDARRQAQQAIERAKGRAQVPVDREGNVIRPHRFRQDDDDDGPKPPTLH